MSTCTRSKEDKSEAARLLREAITANEMRGGRLFLESEAKRTNVGEHCAAALQAIICPRRGGVPKVSFKSASGSSSPDYYFLDRKMNCVCVSCLNNKV